MSYPGIIAETVAFDAHNGDRGEAYYARPTAPGSYPGVVLIHHMPGWDEWMTEQTRKLAHHGFAAICPHLYFREGPGSPDDIGARVRAAGGVADAQVMGDAGAAMAFLRAQNNSNGKVAVMGFCSGGRHAYLTACTVPGFDAVVDCWGGNVVVDDPKMLNAKRPVAPIDLTEKLAIPLIGLFGNDDQNPTADQVNRTEALLKKLGKVLRVLSLRRRRPRLLQLRAARLQGRADAGRLEESFRVPRQTSRRAARRRGRIGGKLMCSYIVEKAALYGSAKGASGWMRIDTANVYYDHPYHTPLDHALAIDFTNEAEGGLERVAVELSAELALALVDKILAALKSGEAAHGALPHAHPHAHGHEHGHDHAHEAAEAAR